MTFLESVPTFLEMGIRKGRLFWQQHYEKVYIIEKRLANGDYEHLLPL